MNINWMNLICREMTNFCLSCSGSLISLTLVHYFFCNKCISKVQILHINIRDNLSHLLKVLHLSLQQVFNEHLVCAMRSARQAFLKEKLNNRSSVSSLLPFKKIRQHANRNARARTTLDVYTSNTILTWLRKPRPGEGKGFDQSYISEVLRITSPALLTGYMLCCCVERWTGRQGGRNRNGP